MGGREPTSGRILMSTVERGPVVKIQTERVGDVTLLEITATTVKGETVRIVQPIEHAVALGIANMIVATVRGADTLDGTIDRILAT